MTKDEILESKERIKEATGLLSIIETAERNISHFEFLKNEQEIVIMSSNSTLFKKFIEYTHNNNLYHSKDDIAPIYQCGKRKDEFLQSLISDQQDFIKKMEQKIEEI